MAIPAGVTRVVYEGIAPNGEIFATGFWLDQSADGPESANNIATSAANALTGNGDGILAIIGADTAYTSVKAYCYPTGGPKATYVGQATIVGGAGTALDQFKLPLQVSMCVTLRSGLAGRRNRGRMYLPATGAQLTNSHGFFDTQVQAAVDSVAGILSTLNSGAPAGSSGAVVVSTLQVGTPAISSVDGDMRPDIQRSRANQEAPGPRVSSQVTGAAG